MAYEDTHCPCGGKKERETMLCPLCMEWLRLHPSMRAWQNPTNSWDYQRQAAMVLVLLAHRRINDMRKPITSMLGQPSTCEICGAPYRRSGAYLFCTGDEAHWTFITLKGDSSLQSAARKLADNTPASPDNPADNQYAGVKEASDTPMTSPGGARYEQAMLL